MGDVWALHVGWDGLHRIDSTVSGMLGRPRVVRRAAAGLDWRQESQELGGREGGGADVPEESDWGLPEGTWRPRLQEGPGPAPEAAGQH